MSNPVKGEVSFESGGKIYIFKLGTNAQIMIEKQVGTSLRKFFHDHKKDDLSSDEVRMIFHAALFRQHKLTLEEVGDLIDDLGLPRVVEIFVEAAASSFGEPKINGDASEDRPLKATKELTGMNS